MKPDPNPDPDLTRLSVKLPKNLVLHTHTHTHTLTNPKLILSLQFTHFHSLSLTLNLTTDPSSVTHSHSRFVLFYSHLLSLQLFIYLLYIVFNLRCLFQLFVSYESHLPSKGTRNHVITLPSAQTESLYVF